MFAGPANWVGFSVLFVDDFFLKSMFAIFEKTNYDEQG
jgi:hypothetical protein